MRNLTQQHRDTLRRRETELMQQLSDEKRTAANSVHNAITAEYAEREYRSGLCQQTLLEILGQLEVQEQTASQRRLEDLLAAVAEEKAQAKAAGQEGERKLVRMSEEFSKDKQEALIRLEEGFRSQVAAITKQHEATVEDLRTKLIRTEVEVCLESALLLPLVLESERRLTGDLTSAAMEESRRRELQALEMRHRADLTHLRLQKERDVAVLSDQQVNSEVALCLRDTVWTVAETLAQEKLAQMERDRRRTYQGDIESLQQQLKEATDEIVADRRKSEEQLKIQAEVEAELDRRRQEVKVLSAVLQQSSEVILLAGEDKDGERRRAQLQLLLHSAQRKEQDRTEKEHRTGQLDEKSPALMTIKGESQETQTESIAAVEQAIGTETETAAASTQTTVDEAPKEERAITNETAEEEEKGQPIAMLESEPGPQNESRPEPEPREEALSSDPIPPSSSPSLSPDDDAQTQLHSVEQQEVPSLAEQPLELLEAEEEALMEAGEQPNVVLSTVSREELRVSAETQTEGTADSEAEAEGEAQRLVVLLQQRIEELLAERDLLQQQCRESEEASRKRDEDDEALRISREQSSQADRALWESQILELQQKIDSLTEQREALAQEIQQKDSELADRSRQLEEGTLTSLSQLAEKDAVIVTLTEEKQRELDEVSEKLRAALAKIKAIPEKRDQDSQFIAEVSLYWPFSHSNNGQYRSSCVFIGSPAGGQPDTRGDRVGGAAGVS